MSDERDSLYFAALLAIRFEPKLREFYLRLKNNGKPGKLAVIAVVHKMITILNARMKEFYY
jgi:transposase